LTIYAVNDFGETLVGWRGNASPRREERAKLYTVNDYGRANAVGRAVTTGIATAPPRSRSMIVPDCGYWSGGCE
jgi:hypothetical protein